MNPNSALTLILADVALRNIREVRRNTANSHLARSVSLTGLLIGYASGDDSDIDQPLVREPTGAIGSLRPGRIDPVVAMNFTALVLIANNRGDWVAHTLAKLAASTADSSLFGELYVLGRVEGRSAFNQMSMHTAIGTPTLAAGINSARPGGA
ncbi:hypothetical protein EP7_001833 [Isosphaeraceae bacterium EP7]